MKNTTNNPSQRQLRVAEQIKEVLAAYLVRGHFHVEELIRHASFVTVTEVRISPDLKHATVFVISHDKDKMKSLLTALNEESFAMQKDINRQMKIKFTPKLQFREDEVFDKAMKLDSIINNLTYSDQE